MSLLLGASCPAACRRPLVRHQQTSHLRLQRPQPSLRLCRAEGDDGPGKVDSKDVSKQTKDRFKRGFEKGGIDRDTAQKIVKVWEETGARNPDDLRKLLLKRSATTAGVVLLQTLLDAGASWGGFSTGSALAAGGDFPGKIILQFLAYFLGLYFLFGVVADFFTLGAVTFSTFQFSSNTKAFMEAVQETAGPKSGLNVVDRVAKAVDSVKVITALNNISGVLKKRQEEGSGENEFDTLKSLTSFLTLSKAEQRGFKPDQFGLTQDEASSIAMVFSRYDTNDDMMLEQSEVNSLFFSEGYDLEPAEVREAIKLLDKNGDGLISFPEFVDWWVNQVSDEAKQKVETAKK